MNHSWHQIFVCGHGTMMVNTFTFERSQPPSPYPESHTKLIICNIITGVKKIVILHWRPQKKY